MEGVSFLLIGLNWSLNLEKTHPPHPKDDPLLQVSSQETSTSSKTQI